MHLFQPAPIDLFKENPFTLIGNDWMLITAQKDQKANTMTASWGGLGVMWGKNVAYVVIRNSRYTKEFVDSADGFSLSFFDKSLKSALKYLGAVSGRDEDKIQNSKMKLAYHNEIPFFDEAHTVFICRKMFAQELTKEHFIDLEIDEKWYKTKDYHVLYIAEITDVLAR